MTTTVSSKRHWRDLSPAQRTGVVLLAAVQITLQVVALRDLRHRSAKEIRGPKAAWVAASFINFAGPLAYLRWARR